MRTADRIQYIRAWSRLGINEYDQRALLRNAATIDRMNEAACNGDWPCDNGERKVKECTACQGLVAPSDLKSGGKCSDCRAIERVRRIMTGYPTLALEFNGDPRGLPFRIETARAVRDREDQPQPTPEHYPDCPYSPTCEGSPEPTPAPDAHGEALDEAVETTGTPDAPDERVGGLDLPPHTALDGGLEPFEGPYDRKAGAS